MSAIKDQQRVNVNHLLNERFGSHAQISFWLKEALRATIFDRDPLDALKDAEILYSILRERAAAVLSAGEEAPANTVRPFPAFIPDQRYSDLLVGALEGGSNEWITSIEYVDMPRRHDVDETYPAYAFFHQYPFGYLLIQTDTEGFKKLIFESFKTGVALMAEKYPKHYADFLSENDDAETADVALQLALFGEIVYG